jgi:DNA-binding HxlR family transcriptional regulator
MLTTRLCSQVCLRTGVMVSQGSPEAGSPAVGAPAARSAASYNEHCPINRAMGLVGSRSAMLVMREAFFGTSRFDDFVQRVEMAPATASTHLRALTEAGLLKRQPYREAGGRTRDEYALTPAGADLMPVVFGLFDWGRRHTDVEPLVDFAHVGCGHSAEVTVRCTAGHDLGPDEIEWRPAVTPAESGGAGG